MSVELEGRIDQTKTRGERVQPEARPAGEGRYVALDHGDQVALAYGTVYREAIAADARDGRALRPAPSGRWAARRFSGRSELGTAYVGPSHLGVPTTPRTRDSQGDQPKRRPAADVVAILTIEGGGVATRACRRRVGLGATRTAPALAAPAHRRAVAREAVSVAEELAAQHQAEH